MTGERTIKLRQYYNSLLGQQRFFEDKNNFVVNHVPIRILTDEIRAIKSDFPGLLPLFNPKEFFSHDDYYNASGIRSYLHVALARLQTAVEETEKYTSYTDERVLIH